MVIIRIGEGQSLSGKILDRNTHWYKIEEKEHAIKDAIESEKKIYITYHNKKYVEISLNKLKNIKIN